MFIVRIQLLFFLMVKLVLKLECYICIIKNGKLWNLSISVQNISIIFYSLNYSKYIMSFEKLYIQNYWFVIWFAGNTM
jgi:hypothetical protein